MAPPELNVDFASEYGG